MNKNNSVKTTYIVCSLIEETFFFLMAILTPIYFTPGYYWWSVISIALLLIGSYGFGSRLNSWGDFGNVE